MYDTNSLYTSLPRFSCLAAVYPADLKYVGSGSELHVPKNITELAVFSGMPEEHKRRTVVIAPRVYKTLQSGDRTLNQYQLTWKHRERWTNPLMGWSSSADPQAMVKLTFDSLEDARAFAEKNGWKYEVRQPVSEKTVEPGSYNYSHNFLTAKTLDILKVSPSPPYISRREGVRRYILQPCLTHPTRSPYRTMAQRLERDYITPQATARATGSCLSPFMETRRWSSSVRGQRAPSEGLVDVCAPALIGEK